MDSIVWFMSALCPRQRGEHNVDGITGLSQLGRRLGTIGLEGVANSELVATLPSNVGFENKRAENGDVYVWLPPDVLGKLNALREGGQSYSDVILRLAKDERV